MLEKQLTDFVLMTVFDGFNNNNKKILVASFILAKYVICSLTCCAYVCTIYISFKFVTNMFFGEMTMDMCEHFSYLYQDLHFLLYMNNL